MFVFRLLAVVFGVCFANDGRERFGEPGAELFVVGDVEARVEHLIREASVSVAGVRVGALGVGEQPQTVVEERRPTRGR